MSPLSPAVTSAIILWHHSKQTTTKMSKFQLKLNELRESVTYVRNYQLPVGVAFAVNRGERLPDRFKAGKLNNTVVVEHKGNVRLRVFLMPKYDGLEEADFTEMSKDLKEGKKYFMVSRPNPPGNNAVVDLIDDDERTAGAFKIYDPDNPDHGMLPVKEEGLKRKSSESSSFEEKRSKL